MFGQIFLSVVLEESWVLSLVYFYFKATFIPVQIHFLIINLIYSGFVKFSDLLSLFLLFYYVAV